MSGFLIDPTDDNVAILGDGKIGHALRILPILEDSRAPSLAELEGAPIVGYGNFNEEARK